MDPFDRLTFIWIFNDIFSFKLFEDFCCFILSFQIGFTLILCAHTLYSKLFLFVDFENRFFFRSIFIFHFRKIPIILAQKNDRNDPAPESARRLQFQTISRDQKRSNQKWKKLEIKKSPKMSSLFSKLGSSKRRRKKTSQ